jgi:hypothetical protein
MNALTEIHKALKKIGFDETYSEHNGKEDFYIFQKGNMQIRLSIEEVEDGNP